jgi:hypothetical protein
MTILAVVIYCLFYRMCDFIECGRYGEMYNLVMLKRCDYGCDAVVVHSNKGELPLPVMDGEFRNMSYLSFGVF